MKVKIIKGYIYPTKVTSIEEKINKFIKDVMVKDIKIIPDTNDCDKCIAMIMYEEELEYPPCPPIEID